MPVDKFKSKEAYRKNLAYRHMHGIPFTAADVVVGGSEHKVKHSTSGPRAKIDARQRKKVSMESSSSTYDFRKHFGRPKKKRG
jgi:hypothetical protein